MYYLYFVCYVSFRVKDIEVNDEGFSNVSIKSESIVPVPAPGIIEVNLKYINMIYAILYNSHVVI